MDAATATESSEPADLLSQACQLHDQGKLREAETSCRRALSLSTGDSEAYRILGLILYAEDRVHEAVDSFQAAVRLDPGNAHAFVQLAVVLGEQGRFADAIAADRKALEVRPNHIEALFHLAQLKVFSASDPDLEALESLRQDQTAFEGQELVHLFFALAKAYDDVGDYDRAYESLQRANTLKRGMIEYNVDSELQRLDQTAVVFNSELLDALSDVGCPSDLPVLIVGMPRSGTTLVEQILASHPAVYGAGEVEYLSELAMGVSLLNEGNVTFPAGVTYLRPDDPARLGEGYVARLRRLAPDAKRVIDKNLLNFAFLGLVHLMVPRAQIIYCTRDPLDTCLSCYQGDFKTLGFAYDLDELGRFYCGYKGLMDHWRRVLPGGAILEVKYEDVVADLEHEARRIVAYCGLEWDSRCLDFYSTQRAVRTNSFAQVRRPIYRDSVARWRRYEAHLQPLIGALGIEPEPARTSIRG